MQPISFQPIGIIHSEHLNPQGTPIQFSGAKDAVGEIEIFPEFQDGLIDLDGFSHLILVYYFHQIKNPALIVKPFMNDAKHGVFATRSPARPNPIGFSVVKLNKVERDQLYVQGLDIINETPLLEISLYISHFKFIDVSKVGWIEKNIHKHSITKDDGRFII